MTEKKKVVRTKKIVRKPKPKKVAPKVEEKKVEATAETTQPTTEATQQAATDPKTYVPEANNSGVAKNFVIRCAKCRWARISSGVKADLVGLHEIPNNCPTCGKLRQFKCPKCGYAAKMKRFQGNT